MKAKISYCMVDSNLSALTAQAGREEALPAGEGNKVVLTNSLFTVTCQGETALENFTDTGMGTIPGSGTGNISAAGRQYDVHSRPEELAAPVPFTESIAPGLSAAGSCLAEPPVPGMRSPDPGRMADELSCAYIVNSKSAAGEMVKGHSDGDLNMIGEFAADGNPGFSKGSFENENIPGKNFAIILPADGQGRQSDYMAGGSPEEQEKQGQPGDSSPEGQYRDSNKKNGNSMMGIVEAVAEAVNMREFDSQGVKHGSSKGTPEGASAINTLLSEANAGWVTGKKEISQDTGVTLESLSPRVLQETKAAVESGSIRILSLTLEPAHLGKVLLKFLLADGEIKAHFFTTSAVARDRLEELLPQVKDLLAQNYFKQNEAAAYLVTGDSRDGAWQGFGGEGHFARDRLKAALKGQPQDAGDENPAEIQNSVDNTTDYLI